MASLVYDTLMKNDHLEQFDPFKITDQELSGNLIRFRDSVGNEFEIIIHQIYSPKP